MKIWLDDIRTPPSTEYTWTHSVDETIAYLQHCFAYKIPIEVIDMDHDLGDYAKFGGDGYKVLLWLIEQEVFPSIRLHTQNVVGRMNMQGLIDRYWRD